MSSLPQPWDPSRLTSAAHLALRKACRQAGDAVSPEHLLTALSRLPTSVAGKALELLDVGWDVLQLPTPPTLRVACVDGLTRQAMRVFRQAAREAQRLGQHPLHTGHLVLGLLSADAGALPAGSLRYSRYRRALCRVLAEPWVHGYALDGEVALYLTRDEALVLYGELSRRRAQPLHPAERLVRQGLHGVLLPVCSALLQGDEGALDAARRRVHGD